MTDKQNHYVGPEEAMDRGYGDGFVGLEAWACPYVTDDDEPLSATAWFVGWCKGRQELDRLLRNDPRAGAR